MRYGFGPMNTLSTVTVFGTVMFWTGLSRSSSNLTVSRGWWASHGEFEREGLHDIGQRERLEAGVGRVGSAILREGHVDGARHTGHGVELHDVGGVLHEHQACLLWLHPPVSAPPSVMVSSEPTVDH